MSDGLIPGWGVPVARSPIAVTPPQSSYGGWIVCDARSAAALTITDCTPLAKVLVRASAGGEVEQSLGVPFGSRVRRSEGPAAERGGVLISGCVPGEWIALGPPGSQAQLLGRLRQQAVTPPDDLVSVVDVTHARAAVRLTGARSADALMRECAIDVSDTACPDGTAFRSAVGGVACDVVRDDLAAERSYLLLCEWSVGQYLYDVLLDAGSEFGIEVDGFRGQGV